MDKTAMKSCGCPDDVCDKIAAHPTTAALGGGTFLALLVSLAKQFGPGIFTAVLSWLETPPTPAPTPAP